MNRWHWVLAVCSFAVLAGVAYLKLERDVGPLVPAKALAARAPNPTSHAAERRFPVPAPAQGPGSVSSGGSGTDWTKKLLGSEDYLAFIRTALPAAMKGDGRAAWSIREALSSCALVIHDYAHSVDPEAQLQEELGNMPHAPQWARDRIERTTRRCLGLANQDPFAGLPPRQGGYSSSYWYKQALADGDPVAREQAAADALAKISVAQNMAQSTKQELLNVAAKDLRSAVESGDPTALYAAGMLLSNGRYSTDPLNGVAVTLAACDLGYDCSAGNRQNSFSNCQSSGDCPADANYAYYLQESLGSAKYAQVYAHAMDIEQSVRAGDWATVMKTLTVDNLH